MEISLVVPSYFLTKLKDVIGYPLILIFTIVSLPFFIIGDLLGKLFEKQVEGLFIN